MRMREQGLCDRCWCPFIYMYVYIMFRALCGFACSIDCVVRSVENNIESIGLVLGLGLELELELEISIYKVKVRLEQALGQGRD